MRSNLIYEAIAVGVLTFIFTFGIYFLMNQRLPDPNEPGYIQMIIGSITVGALMHITLEFGGVNESWCRNTFQ